MSSHQNSPILIRSEVVASQMKVGNFVGFLMDLRPSPHISLGLQTLCKARVINFIFTISPDRIKLLIHFPTLDNKLADLYVKTIHQYYMRCTFNKLHPTCYRK